MFPYNTKPYNTKPYNTKPYNTKPYNTKPYNTKPYNTKPYNTKPYNTFSLRAKPCSNGCQKTLQNDGRKKAHRSGLDLSRYG